MSLIEILAVAAVMSLSRSLCASAIAQTPAPPAKTSDLWGSATLGIASVGHGSGTAAVGQLALARATGQRVISARVAGAADFSDYGGQRGYADAALLVGKRIANPQIPEPHNHGGTTASLSLGLAGLWYTQPPTVSSREQSGVVPAIAFDADVMSHLRFVGLGLSVFGATGTSERYIGVGLTLGAGKIH